MGSTTTKAYSSITESLRVEETNPPDQKYVSEVLLDDSSIDASETPAYLYIDMNGFRHLGLQGLTSGSTPTDVLTVTVEASIQDDGTAPGSCTYVDVTDDWFGVTSWVDTNFLVVKENIPVRWVRVAYEITSGTSDDATLVLWSKKMY